MSGPGGATGGGEAFEFEAPADAPRLDLLVAERLEL